MISSPGFSSASASVWSTSRWKPAIWENDVMRIVVADEISPDSCRLWDIKTNDKLDKDRFRRDLGGLLEAYTEVAKRLGIMSEGERPQGTGPVLVKG